MYSINVLIVTYNQENLIGRALDSILCQKGWGLKSIVISDDCSPDGTWDVLQKYAREYPDIVKPYRNKQNLGIYGNTEALYKVRGEADLYTELAGDDVICNGWFKAVQEYLEKRNINLNGIAATICSDYKIIRPNGMSLINRNNRLVENGLDVLSLRFRGLVSSRSTLFTKETANRFKPINTSFGLCRAESEADSRVFLYSDAFYYIPFVASIYYSQLGVSTRLSSEQYFKDRIEACDWAKEYYRLNDKAKASLDFSKTHYQFQIDPSWANLRRMWSYYWKAFDRYTLSGLNKVTHPLMWFRSLKAIFSKYSNNS